MRSTVWLVVLLLVVSPGATPPVSAGRTSAEAQVSRGRAGGSQARAAQAGTAQATTGTPVTEFEVNGLKVLVKRRDSSQTVVAALFLRGGVRNITSENAGIESLMLDVATEASAAFPRAQMRRELARTGSSLSFGATRDYSAMTLASPRRSFDAGWTMLADAVLRPSFSADDFDRVKARRLIGLASEEDTPDAFIAVLQARAGFAGHPYVNDPDGTPASVKAITLEALKRFHQRMMVTSRLLLVVVGNVDVDDIRRKAQAAFGSVPRGDYVESPLPPLRFAAPALAVTPRDLPTNYVSGLYPAPAPGAPDYYAMRVATTILRDRVFEEVRTKRNLSYAPDAFLSSQGVNSGGLYFTAVDVNQTVQVMLAEVARLQREDVPASLIRSTGQGFLTSAFLDQETNSAQAGVLALNELIGGGWRQGDLMLDNVRAVTPADVRRVAATYMRNLQFVALGNPQSIDRQAFTRQTTP
jgi:predicted Zn-dependent peptidase